MGLAIGVDLGGTKIEVVALSEDGRELQRRRRPTPPFDYEATQVLSLKDSTFDMELRLKHLGPSPFPYGLGQHPWFVRTPGVRLQAKATGMWLEQPPAFPPKTEPAPIPPKWDFNQSNELPEDFIDNGYAGWDGHARIEWTDRGLAVDVEIVDQPSAKSPRPLPQRSFSLCEPQSATPN